MESIFDLPAHPLFVHFPIVLVPLTTLGVIVALARPDWRHRFGPAMVVGAFIGMVATILAAASGEPFNELLPLGDVADKHRNLGERARLLTILFFVATTAMVGVERSSRDISPTAQRVVAVIVAMLGVLATVWIIRTGHEGARITWDGVLPSEG